jgi:hypothetical protein
LMKRYMLNRLFAILVILILLSSIVILLFR